MPHTGPDATVTIKVTYDGTTRRVKMPLREMIPTVLEDNIRAFLHIPTDRKAMIERYSDSASSYVLLNSANVAVYKQLYRAAKAKSKLKLRVTLFEQEPTEPTTLLPKPVSIQEAPETPALLTALPEDQPFSSASQTSLPLRPAGLGLPKDCYDYTAKAATIVAEREELCKEFENRLSCLMKCQFLNSSRISSSENEEAKFADYEDQSTSTTYAVCCNSCNTSIPGAHYHCSICDDGDFDLCQSCIDLGITCYSDHHWLIKRFIVDGTIVNSSTEKLSPKPKSIKEESMFLPTQNTIPSAPAPPAFTVCPFSSPKRTCNMCLNELFEAQFLHCNTCDDFDLCKTCFSGDSHGHHPMHAFTPAVAGSVMPEHINVKLAPGRNKTHMAICDGCDKNITGVRHKCLECPDWDYCADCVGNASFVHPNHRFAAIYEPLAETRSCTASPTPMHMGICCDGPLCKSSGWPSYIRGTRYKCVVCADFDLCANCEANPANEHNKTHPLLKFKTPIRHVSVSTTGEHQDGRQLPCMGDRVAATSPAPSSSNAVNVVQTVVDVKPEAPAMPLAKEPSQAEVKEERLVEVDEMPSTADQIKKLAEAYELKAVFVCDSVPDGTIVGLNQVFQQTWTLRNDGAVAWPVGCAVMFSGGDYMGHIDSSHPTGIPDLLSASRSTVPYSPVEPGQEFQFTVLLRAPNRAGRFTSYWRLATADGIRFGERLWCEVHARSAKATPAKASSTGAVFAEEKDKCKMEKSETEESKMEKSKMDKSETEESKRNKSKIFKSETEGYTLDETKMEKLRMDKFKYEEWATEESKSEDSQAHSTMIFPKLEKESSNASFDEQVKARCSSHAASELPSVGVTPVSKPNMDWDGSDDDVFMTDEEYDILDASDEEYLEEQLKKMTKQ